MPVLIHDPQHALVQRNRLRELYQTKELCDLKLCSSDGDVFHVHTVMLALYIDYFKHISSKSKKLNGTGVIRLDVDSMSLSALLDYIYKGEFAVTSHDLDTVKKSAKQLELFDLLRILEDSKEELNVKQSAKRKELSSGKASILKEQESARIDCGEHSDAVCSIGLVSAAVAIQEQPPLYTTTTLNAFQSQYGVYQSPTLTPTPTLTSSLTPTEISGYGMPEQEPEEEDVKDPRILGLLDNTGDIAVCPISDGQQVKRHSESGINESGVSSEKNIEQLNIGNVIVERYSDVEEANDDFDLSDCASRDADQVSDDCPSLMNAMEETINPEVTSNDNVTDVCEENRDTSFSGESLVNDTNRRSLRKGRIIKECSVVIERDTNADNENQDLLSAKSRKRKTLPLTDDIPNRRKSTRTKQNIKDAGKEVVEISTNKEAQIHPTDDTSNRRRSNRTKQNIRDTGEEVVEISTNKEAQIHPTDDTSNRRRSNRTKQNIRDTVKEVVETNTTKDSTKGNLETNTAKDRTKGNLETNTTKDSTKGNLETNTTKDRTKGNLETNTTKDRTEGDLETNTTKDRTEGDLETNTTIDRTKGDLESCVNIDADQASGESSNRKRSVRKPRVNGRDRDYYCDDRSFRDAVPTYRKSTRVRHCIQDLTNELETDSDEEDEDYDLDESTKRRPEGQRSVKHAKLTRIKQRTNSRNKTVGMKIRNGRPCKRLKPCNSSHRLRDTVKTLLKRYHSYLLMKNAMTSKEQNTNTESSKPKKMHTCNICNKNFKLRSIWTSHIIQNHFSRVSRKREPQPKDKPVKQAAKKPKKRERGSTSRRRRRGETGEKKKAHPVRLLAKRTCPECNKVLTDRKKLQTHLAVIHNFSEEKASEHPSVRIHCDVVGCSYSSLLMRPMERHMKTEHPLVDFRCALCNNRTFYTKEVLEKHMHLKHLNQDKLRFACSVCGKRFLKSRPLYSHEQAKHGIRHEEINTHKCPVEGCGFSTSQSTSIKMHANVHKEKLFSCQYCSLKLKTHKTLQIHMNKIHLGIRPFICEKCGMSFGDIFNLRTHMANKHTEDKEYKCSECSYMTSMKLQFEAHMYNKHGKNISNRKEYHCPHCLYKGLRRSAMKRHMIKHSAARDYTCDECGKTFNTAQTLRAHKTIHSLATYPCPHCNFTTNTEKWLTKHITVQHTFKGMKPYQCPYCPFVCATNGNTRKHIMQRHAGREVTVLKNQEIINQMNEMRKEIKTEAD